MVKQMMVKEKVRISQQRVFKEIEVKSIHFAGDNTSVMTVTMLGADQTR